MLQLMTLSKPSFLLPCDVAHSLRSSSALMAISPRTAYSALSTSGLTVSLVSTLSLSLRLTCPDVDALRWPFELELPPLAIDNADEFRRLSAGTLNLVLSGRRQVVVKCRIASWQSERGFL